MNRILYKNRCRCNEEFSITKKRNSILRSEGKPLHYPKSHEILSKTFQIKYSKKLSPIAKIILNSFQTKYVYYAIDDILYGLKENPKEQKRVLAILYSPIISLQNNFSINFFEIWIREIYIEEIFQTNKFLDNKSTIAEQSNYITIKFIYKTKLPLKKHESLW